MIKLRKILNEVFDSPYKYRHSFSTELVDYTDEETGETYKKDVLTPVQIVRFVTDQGIPYLWYARQNRYDPLVWEIAFGVETGADEKGTHNLNIDKTGKGDAARVFATIISITNNFVEFDEDTSEIQRIIFTSKGGNRTSLYLKIVKLIDHFKVESVRKIGGDESEIMLIRYD